MGGPYDSRLLHAINDWPDSWAPLMRFLSDATTYGWFKAALLVLVVLMLWRNERTRRTVTQALVAFPIANEITDILKSAFPVNRPFQVDSLVHLRMGASESMGTASAHSANMAAIAFVFTYHLRWWGSPWILAAFLTGLSRIYNGVHYPLQVLLGWLVGAFAGLLVTKSWEAFVLQRKRARSGREGDGVVEA